MVFFAFDGHSQFRQIVTSADGHLLLKQIEQPLLGDNHVDKPIDRIYFNPQNQFQKIEGFGYTLTPCISFWFTPKVVTTT